MNDPYWQKTVLDKTKKLQYNMKTNLEKEKA